MSLHTPSQSTQLRTHGFMCWQIAGWALEPFSICLVTDHALYFHRVDFKWNKVIEPKMFCIISFYSLLHLGIHYIHASCSPRSNIVRLVFKTIKDFIFKRKLCYFSVTLKYICNQNLFISYFIFLENFIQVYNETSYCSQHTILSASCPFCLFVCFWISTAVNGACI